jgi:heme oxygenase
MLPFLVLLSIIIISIIIIFKTDKDKIKAQIDTKNKLLQLVTDVKGNCKRYINEENTKAIVIDEVNKKIHLFSPTENINLPYNFDDIIQSEVIIDDNTITSVNRGSQIVGIAVGGLLAGGIGAMLGGLSGGKISKQEIKNIELKLTLNDMNNPTFKINFLSPITKNGWSKDSTKVKNSLSKIDEWQGYIDIILKQQNKVI